MKKIYLLALISCLSIAVAHGQSFSDDFNDNSHDAGKWNAPEVDVGNGELREQNQRLEFSANAASENFVFQTLRRTPGYNEPWQAQSVVSMDKANFSSLNGFGFMGLAVGSSTPGDNYVSVGYAAGVLPGNPGILLDRAFADAGDTANPDGILSVAPNALPEAIGVCLVYDPRLRLISAYFDLDTDQTDGEWTPLQTYTIDGSTLAGAQTLDWGMSDTDNFHLNVDAGAEGTAAAVAAGTAWTDDFEFIQSPRVSVPTVVDNFNDNSPNTAIWGAPMVFDGNGQLLEQNQRLEFSANEAEGENFTSQQLMIFPGYDEAWQAQMVVSMDKVNFLSEGETGGMEMEIGNSSTGPGDERINFGYGAGILPGETENQAIFAEGTDTANGEGLGILDVRALPEAIGIRVTYDPNLRLIRLYYDLDADQTDGEWTFFQAYTIDGTTVAGAHSLNWAMSGGDSFHLGIAGSSEGSAIASGTAWIDDFEFNRGSTATSESGLRFADDFNDDSRSSNWNDPFVISDGGLPELTEVDHRLEFRGASGAGEQEIQQQPSQEFWPQYNQAFEIKTEAHCLPAAMTTEGQVAGLDLVIANNSGNGELLLSVAAIFTDSVRQQVLAADNSEVANTPLPEDFPEALQFGALPEVVGVRVVWAPETKVLSCYFDTDGNRSKETWVLFRDYTLDGSSDKGAAFVSNWGMSTTDQFRIGLNGFAEGTVVTAGEAWFDNFSMLNGPLLSGFDLWAAAIPDPGMRGPSVDASGNGIPNLVQYLYGLAPLATETDVKLALRMEAGIPKLIHGFDGSVTDYSFDYQETSALGGPTWTPGAPVTMIETFQSNGKTFRKVTLPTDPANKFFRLEAIPGQGPG